MRSQILTLLLASCLSVSATRSFGQTPSVDTRLATQNALFEEVYQTDLKNSPERATAVGDYRYNDQLSDRSLVGIVRRHSSDTAFLGRLKAIPTVAFPNRTPSPTTFSSACCSSVWMTMTSKSTRCLSIR